MHERQQPNTTNYAPVNDLRMYYEIHGSGQPLVLLHGGMTTVEDFGFVLPAFAQTRQVIVFDRQGHGHTADINRPFSLEQWADDTAALLRYLNIEQADILGYSTGGSVALAFALRHPEMLRETYTRVAPHPENWPKLVKKSIESVAEFEGWQKKEIRTITAPTLVMVGDSDIVRTEHAVELYRLIANAKLAVLPDTDHIGILVQHAEWTAGMVTEFLSAPMPEETQKGQLEELEHDFPRRIGRLPAQLPRLLRRQLQRTVAVPTRHAHPLL